MALEHIIDRMATSPRPMTQNLPNGTRLDWTPGTNQLRATRLEQRVDLKEQRTFEKYIKRAGWVATQAIEISVPDGMNTRRGVLWVLSKRKAQAEDAATQEALL